MPTRNRSNKVIDSNKTVIKAFLSYLKTGNTDDLKQVSQTVAQMDRVTQDTATTAGVSAEVAEQMSAQAIEMKETVDALVAMVGRGGFGSGKGDAIALSSASDGPSDDYPLLLDGPQHTVH